jgi:hypothetical protein
MWYSNYQIINHAEKVGYEIAMKVNKPGKGLDSRYVGARKCRYRTNRGSEAVVFMV